MTRVLGTKKRLIIEYGEHFYENIIEVTAEKKWYE